MEVIWPWEHADDAEVGWSDPDQGERWAIVAWHDGQQVMVFRPGSPVLDDGTLTELPLAPESHPAPVGPTPTAV